MIRRSLLLCWLLLLLPALPEAADPIGASERGVDRVRELPPGLRARWDEERGLPRRLQVAPRQGEMPGEGGPEATATTFLRRHARTLFGTEDLGIGLERNPSAAVRLVTLRTRASRSGHQVVQQQSVRGIPVEGALVQTNLDRESRVRSVLNRFEPRLRVDTVQPRLPADAAIERARRAIDRPGRERQAPRARLVLSPQEGVGRLVWKVDLPLWDPFGDHEILVDATDGRIVAQRDRMICRKPSPDRRSLDPPPPDPAASLAPTLSAAATGTGLVLPINPLNGHPERYDLRDGDDVDIYRESKSLFRLDGTGYLRGSWADVQNGDSTRTYEPSMVYDYSSLELDGPFHEVNVYWHIDSFQDYLRSSLGILNANARQQPLFAHSGELDNSFYSQSDGIIRYGDGGVDDSEDGEIVVHEYGHAIHDDVVPGFIYDGETGAISEALGDYCAGTFGDNPLEGEWDATSYNPGPPPYLRRLDTDKHYPEDIIGQVHADGEIISGAWWTLRENVGQTIADVLVFESVFLTGIDATFTDFADATIEVDQSLYGGAHVGAIYAAYGARGIGPSHVLEIQHTPLPDSEDMVGPYPVVLTLVHSAPVTAPDAVRLHWRLSGDAGFQTVVMSASALDEWTETIPGPGVPAVLEYYLEATDDDLITVALPLAAPAELFSFTVGADTDYPVVTHTPLPNQPLAVWPPTVQATVTDNLGVGAVTVTWLRNGVPQAEFPLVDQGNDLYEGAFPILPGLAVGDAIEYRITATDRASFPNVSVVGPYPFSIIESQALVLILDDDAGVAAAPKWLEDKTLSSPSLPTDMPRKGASATGMAATLAARGYSVVIESAATSDPAGWAAYDLLISTSGANADPLASSLYRSALVAWVGDGGRLLIEGGEVAYDATIDPRYPEVMYGLIHAYDWDHDTAGPLLATTGSGTHPLRNTPNVLPDTLGLSADLSTHQDSVKPWLAGGGLQLVYGTTVDPDNAGILVFDDNLLPEAAQIVYLAFDWTRLDDRNVADDLLENAVAHLLASEGTNDASIAGTVMLEGTLDYTGITVVAEPSGVSTLTDASGDYLLEGLYAGSYTITAIPPEGWEQGRQDVTVATSESVTGVDFLLRPVRTVQFCSGNPIAIPDNDPAGLSIPLLVDEQGELADVLCWVDITHSWIGDLVIELHGPGGQVVRLHDRSGGNADDIVTSYDDLTPVSGPGHLDDFTGLEAEGQWTLWISDNQLEDTGTLNDWCLTLQIVDEDSVAAAVGPLQAENVPSGVRLRWTAYAVDGIQGFHVLRSVEGGPSTLLREEPLAARLGDLELLDPLPGVRENSQLDYRLAVVQDDGKILLLDAQASLVYAPVRPRSYSLDQNFPNPFNPVTTIRFSLPEAGWTTVRIYNVAGRLVRELVAAELAARTHVVEWDGTDARGRSVSTGSYYLQLRSGRFQETRRMMLVK